MYQCPYCTIQRLKSGKPFVSWISVRNHVSKCERRTGEYFIDVVVGPIHYTELNNLSRKQILSLFPELKSNLTDILKSFKSRNILIEYCSTHPIKNTNKQIKKSKYTDNYLLEQLQQFYTEHNRSPSYRDFIKNSKYPSCSSYERRFGSWNKALELAGLPLSSTAYTKQELLNIGKAWIAEYGCTPEARDFGADLPSSGTVIKYFGSWNAYILEIGGTLIENTYGRPTQAFDGKTYRSRIEAKLADIFRNLEIHYEYETAYPLPYNRFYDFYLPKFDVYIELDGMGEARDRDVINEKIEINRQLGRRLIVIYPDDVDKLTVEKLLTHS